MFTSQTPYFETLQEAQQLKQKGEHKAAITICEELLLDDLECAEAYEEIGDNFLSLREFDKGIKALEKALELKEDSANAHYLIGFAYSSVNKWAKSIVHLERANKLQPNHPEILRCLGWSIFHGQREQQGLIVLERARSLSPEDCFVLSDLGVCYLTRKEFNTAEDIFQQIVKLDPRNQRAQECLKACQYFKSKMA